MILGLPARLAAAVAALVVLGVALVAGVVVLGRANESSSSSTVPRQATPASTSFPAPPSGAVVFSREDGTDALALALVPDGGELVSQVSVVGGQGLGVRGLAVDVTVRADSRTTRARAVPCGAGCYRVRSTASSEPREVTVRVTRKSGVTVWNVPLPKTWPPPSAAALVARAQRVWRNLHSLAFSETLRADPERVVRTHWAMVAPDRLSYEIAGGGAGVIIGDRRWDRQEGRWRKSEQLRLDVPTPQWASVANAHVLGSTTVRGRAVWRVSFYDRQGQAWFTLGLEKQTLRTLELRMVTTAHFMHHVYGPFNAPLVIRPPS